MDLSKIAHLFDGVTVTVVTTSATFPIAVGEIVEASREGNILVLKLTVGYDGIPAGAIVFFNTNQIIAIS